MQLRRRVNRLPGTWRTSGGTQAAETVSQHDDSAASSCFTRAVGSVIQLRTRSRHMVCDMGLPDFCSAIGCLYHGLASCQLQALRRGEEKSKGR